MSEPRGLINLNPPELSLHARHRRQVHELLAVGGLFLMALTLGTVWVALRLSRSQQAIQQLDRVLAQLEPQAEQFQAQLRISQVARLALDERQQLTTLLSGTFQTTPETILLEAVTFDQQKHELSLRGYAKTTQDVLEYITQLERLDGVANVRMKYSTRRQGSSGERTDFEIMLNQGQRRETS